LKLLALLLVAALALGAFVLLTRDSSAEGAVVARVIDGDTIDLVDGRRIRLVQIDAPEKDSECYGDESTAFARRLLPPGTEVRIEQDPVLDQVDRFGRRLAYVWKDEEDVNVSLVREGAAGVWFFDGRQGRHAQELLGAAERARAQEKGLWGACPLARFDPLRSLASGPSRAAG
jgi:endonuclease YncB( thermonuclease family)